MLGIIGLFLYFNFKAGLDSSLDRTLKARANDVTTLLRRGGVPALERQRSLLTSGELTVQLIAPAGTVRFSTTGADGGAPLLPTPEVRRATTADRLVDEQERERILTRRTAPGGDVILVRTSIAQRERALELLGGGLVIGGGLTLLVSALAGYLLAGAVLRPMEAMRRAAAAISDVDPHARLPLPPGRDEVHRLGSTLNDMLARVERARDRERTFVCDASHELRTPLAILKTEIEVALRQDHPPEALRAALQVAGEEADRLTLLTDDLLLVARSDSGHLELHREKLDARDLLDDVVRRFTLRAHQTGRTFLVHAPAGLSVEADRARVLQALTNLVDNALRHGAGTVTLRAEIRGGDLELHVLDEGPGLPSAFIPHAFERFSQAHAGRSGEGTGLGLAIVALIAQAHGGRATAANRAERTGADLSLALPGVA